MLDVVRKENLTESGNSPARVGGGFGVVLWSSRAFIWMTLLG